MSSTRYSNRVEGNNNTLIHLVRTSFRKLSPLFFASHSSRIHLLIHSQTKISNNASQFPRAKSSTAFLVFSSLACTSYSAPFSVLPSKKTFYFPLSFYIGRYIKSFSSVSRAFVLLDPLILRDEFSLSSIFFSSPFLRFSFTRGQADIPSSRKW